MERTFVIGDIHGCLEELDELVRACGVRPGVDRLILAGDLVDRGPDPAGVVRRARELGAECVLGNHEEKLIRFFAHERAGTAPNPVRVWPERVAEWRRIDEDDRAWLATLPGHLRIGTRWLVVHAGFEAHRPVAEQKAKTTCRVQWLDARGRAVSTGDPKERPPGTDAWTARWRGPENVVYGHAVHDLAVPRVDEPAPGVRCFGIDTGCVHGGRLTALVIDSDSDGGDAEPEVVQVQARRLYFGGAEADA